MNVKFMPCLFWAVLAGASAADPDVRPPPRGYADYERLPPGEPAPEFLTIPAARPDQLTPASSGPGADFATWTVSHGDAGSRRYSALNQINRTNVARLRQAWLYRSGDGAGNIQANPIIVNGVMYAPTVGRAIVALNAATGTELWRYEVEAPASLGLTDAPARRGLVYWAGAAGHPARIIFASGKWLYALDPATGRPVAEFGEGGRAPFPGGGTAVGVIWRDTYIVPGFAGDIFAYDLRSGKSLWRFHTIPRDGEFGADTWNGTDRAGANCWGGVALDVERGIVFAAIGDPHPNFFGGQRQGDNLFSNCLLALDARTGARLWHFQVVRHDLWDLDNPAPPNLVTITREGRQIDAVACVTKSGITLLLDRVSGLPVFPFRLRRAPASGLAGELAAPYQPDPELPEPFSEAEFRLEDVTDRTPDAHAAVLAQVQRATYGWFRPPVEGQPMLFRSTHGGAEWTGAAIDVPSGRLYVSSNHVASRITVYRADPLDAPDGQPPGAGEKLYQQACAACHGDRRQGMGMAPPLLGLRHRMDDGQLTALLQHGRGAMPPAPPAVVEQLPALLDFLLRRKRVATAGAGREGPPSYFIDGFGFLNDPDGYPGVKPPWGRLNCIDLNTGKILWRVPLGEYPELTRQGVPLTGTENFGGPTVTAGGLVFCAGTRDRRLRAFDADTGRELWCAELPWGGYAPPSIYEVDGRQFVVIAASGGGKLNDATGDAYVAFALP
jgi:quinoprotein glucose dehydrogenase